LQLKPIKIGKKLFKTHYLSTIPKRCDSISHIISMLKNHDF
jgi:hypothetical protein